MSRLAQTWPLQPLRRQGRAVMAGFRPGWRASWRRMTDWAEHRALVVATPAAAPVLLTRVNLNGCVQTKVHKLWLAGLVGSEGDALVAQHFRAVADGLAGWPALVALTRGLSWLSGAALAGVAVHDMVAAGWDGLLRSLLSWHVWLPAVLLVLGAGVRLGLRIWIEREVRLGLS